MSEVRREAERTCPLKTTTGKQDVLESWKERETGGDLGELVREGRLGGRRGGSRRKRRGHMPVLSRGYTIRVGDKRTGRKNTRRDFNRCQ